jgi:hypothetical protein
MVALIVGMLLCVGLALAVVALVAIPARRQGRDVLTPQGEEIMAMAKERTQDALDKTGEALVATKDKVSESISAAAATGTPSRETATAAPAAPAPAARDTQDTPARRAS